MKPALCSFCELTPGFTAPTVPISQHTKGRRVPCNQHYKEPAMQANQLFAKPTVHCFQNDLTFFCDEDCHQIAT